MYDDLPSRVGAALGEFFAEQAEVLGSISGDLEPVLESVRAFVLQGGKRVRPAFAYWGAIGAGADDSPALVCAASSLELLQACALIHDDVMDGSDLRRGRPSLHQQFGSLHRGQSFRGDAQTFGVSAAILLGDLCLIWGDRMLDTSGLDPAALARVRPVHDLMRAEVMAGQYLDVLEQARADGDIGTALQVARYKSAKYTIERPLHFGAAIAGADETVVAAYTAIGLPLGEAFQLRDDVLGIFGDPAETGKPAGDDLREGKRTVLIAAALASATPPQREFIETHLGDQALDAEGVDRLREVIVTTGALAETERMILDGAQKSLAAIEEAPLTRSARAALATLANAATARRT